MAEPVASPLAAALADRYRIERELGQGGMATVYLAEDLRHHRRVAVKVLKPELAAVIGAERFLREIQTVAALQHPHILGLFDSGVAEVERSRGQGVEPSTSSTASTASTSSTASTASSLVYYVMPFVEGESLRDRLTREKQLPIADAIRIASEVASALDYAHRHGVIHRDIKPENILLHDGSALVADFGIALAVSRSDGAARMTETGMSLGTPHYMSPEQAMGEREIGPRSDVYALGCVTYEMLTGDPPFTASTAQAIVAKVMTEKPVPPSRVRDRVPETVEDAVLTALEKLPADRFASAAGFAAAFEASTGRSPRWNTGRAMPPMREASSGYRRLSWALALIALGALLFGFRETAARRHDTPERVVRFDVEVPDGYQPSLSDAQGPDLDISPDGSALVFCVIDPHGARQLFVRRMDEDAGHALPGTEGAYAPTFSPDGASVLYWAAGRFLKVALSGGAPQLIGEPGGVQAHTWTPGGIIVYAVQAGPYLMRVPESGGKPEVAAQLDSAHGEGAQYFPRALSDGKHVLYESWGRGGIEDARIGLLDLSTGRARRLAVRGTSPLGMLDGQLVYSDQAGTILSIPLDLKSGATGGQPLPLVEGVATGARGSAVAALSTDGTLTYAGGNQLSMLVLANATGETTLLPDSRLYSFPRFSPNGKRVAVTVATGASSDIWLMDTGLGSLMRLTSGGTTNERPEWSPNGERVLFRTARGAHSAIWWQPADGSGPAKPLIANDTAEYFEGVMTPDGLEVIYQVDTSNSDVMVRPTEGGTPNPIATTGAIESQARVSPDGKWVAYVTDESGIPQVVVQPLPGPGARVQVSVRGGTEPVWSRDGRRLFYRAEGKFKVADVATNPAFRVIARADFMNDIYLPQPAPHANFDVSPDGTRLLVLKGNRQRLLVVHGWRSEMRARLSAGAQH